MLHIFDKVDFDERIKPYYALLTEMNTKNHLDFYRLHDALVAELQKSGSYGDDCEQADFWHIGDWYNTHYDHFNVDNPKALSNVSFPALKRILLNYCPDSLLYFCGSEETPLSGLELVLHPTFTFATWAGFDISEIERKCSELNIS
jgi:hypothetical protein